MVSMTQLGIMIKTLYDGKGAKAATRDLQELDKTSKKSATSVDRTQNALRVMAIAAVGVATAFYAAKKALDAAQKAFDFTREGAALVQLEESFERMNLAVFKTPDLLKQMSEASRGTIKESTMMAGVLNMVAGLTDENARAFAEAAPRLLEVAKAANKLNPLLGTTERLYDRLTLGIKRGSIKLIDDLGIRITAAEAYKKMAASLNKSVLALTAEEKQLAVLNEVMEKGDLLIKQVGGSVDAQTDSWDLLTASLGDFAEGMKKTAAENSKYLVGSLAGMVGTLADVERETSGVSRAIVEALGFQVDWYGAIKQAKKEAVDLTGVSRRLSREFLENSYATSIWSNKTEIATISAKDLEEAEKALAEQLKKRGLLAWEVAETEADRLAIQREVADHINGILLDAEEAHIESLKDLGKEYDDLDLGTRANMFRVVGDAIGEMIAEIKLEKFERAQEAIQSMLDPMRSNTLSLFNEDLDQLGYRLVTVGGRTADQNRLLGMAQDEYDSLGQKITDMSAAPVLFSKNADEAAESIGGWVDRQGELIPLMDELGNITSSTSSYIQEATWNEEALTQALFDSTAALMTDKEAVLGLGVSFGLLNEQQAAALLQQYRMANEYLPALAAALAAGEISADDATEAMMELAAGEFESAEQAIALKKEMDAAREALENISKIWEIKVSTVYDTVGTPGKIPGENPQNPMPNIGPAMQHGANFVVPPGYPNDSFPMRVTSGEHVQVTPRGKGRGGNIYITNQFILRGGGNPYAIAQEAAAANRAAIMIGDKTRG